MMGNGKFVDWDTPETLLKIRRMARNGKTTAEIKDALGWDVALGTVNERLKRFGIRAHNPAKRAHRGYETSIPPKA